MTASEAIDLYTKKFGGFPMFLFMGAEDREIITAVEKSLKDGKEIEAPDDGCDY